MATIAYTHGLDEDKNFQLIKELFELERKTDSSCYANKD